MVKFNLPERKYPENGERSSEEGRIPCKPAALD
jgi:hypothetical protein